MNTVVIKEVRVIYIAMEFRVVQFTHMEAQRDISSLLILDQIYCRIVLTALSFHSVFALILGPICITELIFC